MSGYRVQTAQFPKEYIAQQRLTVRDQGLPVFRCRPRLELAEQQWRSASDKLDALKAQGNSRSATAQQLLAQKVTFATMLHAFGVEDA